MAVGILLASIGYFNGANLSLSFGWDDVQTENRTPHTINQDHLSRFDSIVMDINDGKSELIPSDHYGVVIQYYGDNNQFESHVDGSTLNITEKSPDDSPLHMNFGFRSESKNTVKIYYPKDISFQKLNIKSSLGDFSASSFKSDKTEVDLSFGKVKLSDATCGNTIINEKNGDCSLNNISASALVLHNDFGGTALQNITVASNSKSSIIGKNGFIGITNLNGGSLEVNNDFGSVTMKALNLSELKSVMSNGSLCMSGSNIQKSNFENAFGNIQIDTLISNGSNIQCKNGAVSLSGELRGNTTVHSDFGNTEVTTSLQQNQYSYQASSKFGSVKINGNKVDGTAVQASESKNTFNVSSSNGDVSLRFSK